MKITRRRALQSASALALLSGCKTSSELASTAADASIYDLRVDYIDRPLGTSSVRPLLSWKMRSERRGARQVAYRIRVARDEATLAGGHAICGIADGSPVHAQSQSNTKARP